MQDCQEIAREWDLLALEVGRFIRYWGFKTIHGRIWTHIYLSNEPLDAGALMERFGLSKALMSLSLNDLLKYQVILEGPKSERGTQTYIANPEVLNVILEVLRRREKRMLEEIKTAHSSLSSLSSKNLGLDQINPTRLTKLGQMIDQAQSTLNAILELAQPDLKEWCLFNEDSASSKHRPEQH